MLSIGRKVAAACSLSFLSPQSSHPEPRFTSPRMQNPYSTAGSQALGLEQKADYSEEKKEEFGDYAWIPLHDPSLLDYDRCEFLLVATAHDLHAELGGCQRVPRCNGAWGPWPRDRAAGTLDMGTLRVKQEKKDLSD